MTRLGLNNNQTPEKPMRLQLWLARAGLGSRRAMDRLIEEGKVLVNGSIARLGHLVTAGDDISIAGEPITPPRHCEPTDACQILIYHKPVGLVCSRRAQPGLPTIFDALSLPASPRWIAVGRLDCQTSGLLMLTNHGVLAHRLMHPSHEILRQYWVTIEGTVPRTILKQLQHGIMLDDGLIAFEKLEVLTQYSNSAHTVLQLGLREGRYRAVRRAWAAVRQRVLALKRVAMAGIELPSGLQAGAWQALDREEVTHLMQKVGL